MEEPMKGNEPASPKARPVLLTVMCILTFIGSGMNFISGMLFFAFFDTFQLIIGDISKSFNIPGTELLMDAKPVFFLVSSLVYAISFSGALLMFNLKKIGFHLYTIAQILLIIAPMYFFKLPGPSILDVVLSGIFVVLYGTQLKNMK
jgi:hypothetical protein